MSEQHLHRAIVQPVPEGTPRPLWSVMIPTYNCANYLRETLLSILAQDPGPETMQIEVVDDHSTKDNPAAIVEELGSGRVSFYRQPCNVGAIKNFETCLQRSRGQFIHLLHGDDCVMNGFYQRMQFAFEKEPKIGAAFCRHVGIDENSNWLWFSELLSLKNGVIENWLEQIAVINQLQPPSIVVKRAVYENIGGFDHRICCCAEDWEMWVRIAASYPVWYETAPLALYRSHSSSLTGRCARSGQNMRDLRKIIEIIYPYLPEDSADELTRKSKESWAIYGIKYIAASMLREGDISSAAIQVQEALKCSRSLKVIKELSTLITQFCKQKLKNTFV